MPRPTGSSIAPIFLRIAIGVTFIWAGLGKLEGEMRVSGEPAAILANMGLHIARKNAQPSPADAQPTAPAPDANPADVQPPPVDRASAPGATAPAGPNPPATETPGAQPATAATPPAANAPQPVLPEGQSPEQPRPGAPGPEVTKQDTNAMGSAPPLTPSAAAKVQRTYLATEFPKEFAVKRVYGLALMLHRAAHPAPRADLTEPSRLWPQRMGRGTWPLFFAWSVAICEVVGGVCVLTGLLTRVSAVGLACVMIAAMWLTEVGPAVQAGTTVLGFIPDRDWLAVDQWKTLFWQFSLVMGALALAFLGSGALGFDRKLFPPIPPAPTNVKPMI
ncbi:MAG: DoxX family membrane protein [Phycisphaerales bacterium]